MPWFNEVAKQNDQARAVGRYFYVSLKLDTPIQFLKGVGPKLGETLRKKGVATVKDLLEWYPRTYEDRRAARNISSLRADELVSLRAQVLRVSAFQLGRSKRKFYEVTLVDESGRITCKYFRVPYKGYFERFQPRQWVRVIGKVTDYRGRLEFHHPDIQDDQVASDADQDRIIPVYPESEGITNRQLRKLVATALQAISDSKTDPTGAYQQLEKLPEWIREQCGLPDRYSALSDLHLPAQGVTSVTAPEVDLAFLQMKSPAHRRIIFEEFFWLELFLAAKRAGLKRDSAPAFTNQPRLIERFKSQLPFSLTKAQLRALDEIIADLCQPYPMHRLVQGDVGSGKTLVAFAAALVAIANGFQVAIMVPTEILAEQHEKNAKKFLSALDVSVGCLTGSMNESERGQTLSLLKSGAIQLIIGTHALIQDTVEFNNLGLVIVDEQHRFGVHQRNQLKHKGLAPHFLIMTATPIPRTLAMTVYGDLDVSVIDELPKGRSPIVTRVTYESKRPQVMLFLKEQLQKGRQAYIVYPLVEESEKLDLKDAVSGFSQLQTELSGFRVGLLHGKMRPLEKDQVMLAFRNHEIDVLVSTTVIEVGVDVANATFMLIEHAERFGLSQLHQLRGRVGRGEEKSYCVLMLGYAVSDDSRARCEIMEKTTDGFKIAEADLEFRGPGEFLGIKQSGLPGFKLANLVRDVAILQEARNAAFAVLQADPELKLKKNRLLREELLRSHGATALASVG